MGACLSIVSINRDFQICHILFESAALWQSCVYCFTDVVAQHIDPLLIQAHALRLSITILYFVQTDVRRDLLFSPQFENETRVVIVGTVNVSTTFYEMKNFFAWSYGT